MSMAIKHFEEVSQDETADPALKTMDAALLASAEGDWERAAEALRQIVDNDPENFVVCICVFTLDPVAGLFTATTGCQQSSCGATE